MIKKKVKRADVPKGGIYFYDNYEKIISKQLFDPTLVTEAIFNKNIRFILKRKIHSQGGLKG